MYPMRVVRCQGQGQGPRAMRCGPSAPSRGLASFLPGPYIRHARGGHPFAAAATDASNFADFNPWFRNFDEQMTRAFDSIFPSATGRQSEEVGEVSSPHQHRRPVRTFEPRFDVRETEHAYELRGELPGVEPSGVSVEFSDANTLVISGSTESSEASSSEGRPSAVEQQQSSSEKVDATATVNAVANETSDTASVASNDSTSSYVKPTVEDEDAPATSAPAATEQQSEQQVEQQQQQAEQQQQPTYWYHERTTGTFQRTFRFPANGGRGIDIDGVTASLKNGVLDVKVPKVIVERRSIVVN